MPIGKIIKVSKMTQQKTPEVAPSGVFLLQALN